LLTKLFIADQQILPLDFSARLAVRLEDHIGLRVFYPELERPQALTAGGGDECHGTSAVKVAHQDGSQRDK
jgi:hypothetical protein